MTKLFPREKYKFFLMALILLSLASACVLFLGRYIYQKQKSDMAHAAQQQLTAIAELKVWEIDNWQKERIDAANVIYKNDVFSSDVMRYLKNPSSPELRKDILALLSATQVSHQYKNILLLDKNKEIRLALKNYDIDYGRIHAGMIEQAAEKNKIMFSDFYRDERAHSLHLAMIIPVMVPQGKKSAHIGTILKIIDPAIRLYPAIKLWPLPGRTGEALLVNRQGSEVVFLNELRHVQNQPLGLRRPITETNLPAVKAVLGVRGVVDGVDYRQKNVLAVSRAVPNTPWFLVAKIDDDEVYAPSTERFWAMIFITIIVISMLGVIVAYIWRNQQAKYYREQYELEYKRAFLYARSLIEASLDPLVTISPEGKITDVNEATELITGQPRKELIGSNFSNYFTEPRKADEGYKLVLQDGVVRDYPLSIRHMSGRVTEVLYNASLYKNEAGDVQGIFASARDVTELRRMTRELKAAHGELELRVQERTNELVKMNEDLQSEIRERREVEKLIAFRTKLLEATNKELESFTYSVSHDLRAPLRAIDGYARMILRDQKDNLDSEARRRFDLLRGNAQMMGKLIDDLLSFSRMGRLEINMSKLDMEGLVNDIRMELQVITPDRTIDFKMDELPPGWGDRTLIKQVLFNLLSNAVKYTKRKDRARIETGGCRDGNENIYYIKDNGVGFDMAYYDKLFGVFQRLHSAVDYEGTGVGLAIVQRIILRHHGRVWAEGNINEGATFYFSLPVKE
ncbi:MAG: PAS domain S-box protein [Deltaproteobacteria bacterium]